MAEVLLTSSGHDEPHAVDLLLATAAMLGRRLRRHEARWWDGRYVRRHRHRDMAAPDLAASSRAAARPAPAGFGGDVRDRRLRRGPGRHHRVGWRVRNRWLWRAPSGPAETSAMAGAGEPGGDYGTGGSPFPDGGTCSAPTQGPLSTSDSPRPFGWTFTGPTTGAGGAAGSVDGGTGPARCQTVPGRLPWHRLRGDGHAAGADHGNGRRLRRRLQADLGRHPPLGAHALRRPAGRRHARHGLGPLPGEAHGGLSRSAAPTPPGRWRSETAAGPGKVRFFDQQGDVLPNLTAAQIMDIFGTTATQIFSCTFPTYAGCYSFLRSEFDEQLGTTPPQTIVDATLTKVTTPNGIFQVIWASSVESYVKSCRGAPTARPWPATPGSSRRCWDRSARTGRPRNQPLALWTSRGGWFKQPAR